MSTKISTALSELFSDSVGDTLVDDQRKRLLALNVLLDSFTDALSGSFPGVTKEDVNVDLRAASLAVSRFRRDVYFVRRLAKGLRDIGLDEGDRSTVMHWVMQLGLRISSDSPRKTKAVAAFTLWMVTLRPYSIATKLGAEETVDQSKARNRFNAAFVWWVSTSELKRCGEIVLDELPDAATRRERILHDFTYRDVTYSALEFLYAGIFRQRLTPNL